MSKQNAGLFEVTTSRQTYLNLLYLILSFPLGVFYFVFLIVGLSVGASLAIMFIGLPILLVTLAASRALVSFERRLAVSLLDADIPPPLAKTPDVQGIWARIRELLSNSLTWKGLAYLFAKFPFGVFSFSISITLVSLSLGLIATPLVYEIDPLKFGFWKVDTGEESLMCVVVGVVVGIISLHVFNGLAFLWGRFTVWMLSAPESALRQSEASGPVVIA